MCLIPLLANFMCKLAGTGNSDVSGKTAVKTLTGGITWSS